MKVDANANLVVGNLLVQIGDISKQKATYYSLMMEYKQRAELLEKELEELKKKTNRTK